MHLIYITFLHSSHSAISSRKSSASTIPSAILNTNASSFTSQPVIRPLPAVRHGEVCEVLNSYRVDISTRPKLLFQGSMFRRHSYFLFNSICFFSFLSNRLFAYSYVLIDIISSIGSFAESLKYFIIIP